MSKILESNNYDKFELCQFNRDTRNIKALETSMRKHGWVDAYPCHVVQNGSGKFKIKAGHHRFEVAKKLGIPIKFVVCNDNMTIHELERATTSWSVNDYLISFCKSGYGDYIILKDYCDETGLGASAAANVLMNRISSSGGMGGTDFKEGKFKIRYPNYGEKMKEYILLCKSLGIQCYKAYNFINAISRVFFVDEVDFNILKRKTKAFKFIFENKLGLDQYLEMIEDVYNRQSREKIPVKFLAYQAGTQRLEKTRHNNLKQYKKRA